MPVILAPEAYERWLANIEPDPRDLLVPFPAELMMMWPISTRVNKPDNDDPNILDPLEPVDGGSPTLLERWRNEGQPCSSQPERHRFEMDTPAGLAVADYRLEGDVMTIYHTEVPLQLRGRGYGYHLVRGTLEEVRRLNLKVVPRCWFVRDIIARQPALQDLLA